MRRLCLTVLLVLCTLFGAQARPRFGLRVSEKAGPWEARAAQDLGKYLGQVFDAEVAPGDEGELTFVVGQLAIDECPAVKKNLARLSEKPAVLRRDAIALEKVGSTIYLAGSNDDSHYFAAAYLLQKLGCRWYMPTEFGECIPHLQQWPLAQLSLAYAPPFEVRTYWISWNGDRQGYEEFAHRNFYNLERNPPGGHALGVSRFTKGELPMAGSWNSASTVAAVVQSFDAEYAAGKSFSLAIKDMVQKRLDGPDADIGGGLHDKFFEAPVVSDIFLAFYNAVSEQLMQLHPSSQAKIGFLAYVNLTLAPQRGMVAAAPLVAYLAPIDIDPLHAMGDPRSPQKADYQGALTRWAEVMQGRVVLYDYDQSMLVWRDLPNPSHEVLRKEIKLYQKLGILGFATESRNAIATTFTNLFFRGQLYWNPDFDVEGELALFYRNFYGPLAEPMGRYWNAIYAAWQATPLTYHEFFVIADIYTPELVAQLGQHLHTAEAMAGQLTPAQQQRLDFTRRSFELISSYTEMARKAGSDCDFAAAVQAGKRGLASREELTKTSGIFTTYVKMPEKGPAWWPGEVEYYGQLDELCQGKSGRFLAKTPLVWKFRADPYDEGLWRNWSSDPPDAAWRDLRVDSLPRAQGVYTPDYHSPEGFGWYRCTLELNKTPKRAHLVFPGLFNESWVYLDGVLVAHRPQKSLWWLNDYRFLWDVELPGLGKGSNQVVVRTKIDRHPSGMFRRPFLYEAAP
ncbi:MAG: DUF4838 domain-containing protein [Candidatus Eremiobacteraeota bacterium]|nr:DUF4838 domain-containing protein [Candidatus Eremiobacteraeota bacterium]